jgi:hypothetical protein
VVCEFQAAKSAEGCKVLDRVLLYAANAKGLEGCVKMSVAEPVLRENNHTAYWTLSPVDVEYYADSGQRLAWVSVDEESEDDGPSIYFAFEACCGCVDHFFSLAR